MARAVIIGHLSKLHPARLFALKSVQHVFEIP